MRATGAAEVEGAMEAMEAADATEDTCAMEATGAMDATEETGATGALDATEAMGAAMLGLDWAARGESTDDDRAEATGPATMLTAEEEAEGGERLADTMTDDAGMEGPTSDGSLA